MLMRALAVLALLQLPTPAGLRPVDVTMYGYWAGVLTIGGEQHEVTLHFSPRERVPVTLARRKLDGLFPLQPSRYHYDASSITAAFPRPVPFDLTARKRSDGKGLDVAIVQDGARQSALFTRVAAPGGLKRPQTPQPPFPYSTFDDLIDTGNGILGATVTMPPGRGPFPGVVLLSGTGPQDRDNSFAHHRPFAVLADYLTRRGFAVLRFDDRETGRSSGLFKELRTAEADAGDAVSALRFLRAYPGVDAARTGFVAHSEGGQVAPIAAARTPDVLFMVLLGSPAVDIVTVSLMQHEAIGRARGRSENSLAFERRVRARILDVVRASDDVATAREQIGAIIRAATIEAGPPDLPWLIELKEGAEVLLREHYAGSFRQRMMADPALALRELRLPVLALFAALDVQVPAVPNAAAMRDALAHSSPLTEVRTLTGLNHAFQTAKTGAVEEYAVIEETFAPAALEAIGEWLARVTKR